MFIWLWQGVRHSGKKTMLEYCSFPCFSNMFCWLLTFGTTTVRRVTKTKLTSHLTGKKQCFQLNLTMPISIQDLSKQRWQIIQVGFLICFQWWDWSVLFMYLELQKVPFRYATSNVSFGFFCFCFSLTGLSVSLWS